jgi:heterotetrameric sarcosine oxidase delta subunit
MSMRLRIPCPHCGIRAVEEFVYGELPDVPAALTDPIARDLDKAFMHTNAEGVVTERWFHASGCRRWCTVTRDTTDNTTNAI